MGTEGINVNSANLDTKKPEEALAILLRGQLDALSSVSRAFAEIADGAKLLADTIRNGGSIAYAAAGSSGLMAMSDGLELPGTFSIPNNRITILLAGGFASLKDMLGSTEDDEEAAIAAVKNAGLKSGDCLIGVSASGSTPYTLAAIKTASVMGVKTIGMANNPEAPLLQDVDLAILLETPPEMVAGSTRMGAGTAQKAALNMLSTLMAIQLGHVHDGYMVNVRADNDKLRRRATSMVSNITGCSNQKAQGFLDTAGGSVKMAILLASGVENAATAAKLLETNGSSIRRVMDICTGKH